MEPFCPTYFGQPRTRGLQLFGPPGLSVPILRHRRQYRQCPVGRDGNRRDTHWDDRGRRLRRAGALARPRGRDGVGDDGAERDAQRRAPGAATLEGI